jgi:N-formylglutamate amidohydrolase
VCRHGRCLVVDCHSFPSFPLPYELDQSPDRPDICIGTDAFHTPAKLADEVIAGFQLHGYTVALNRPFAGSLVPAKFYRNDANVAALMIEVNRALYMDEQTGAKSGRFDETRTAVAQLLERLTQHCRYMSLMEGQDQAYV